ncbi:MAG TPA: uroporphyrinogen decarboxylase [Candidatus Limnocylindrales bacterium]
MNAAESPVRAVPADGVPAAAPAEPRARFLRACRRLPVDATPVWFMRQAGRALPEYRAIRERASLVEITRDAALCAEVTLQPVRRLGVDAAILFADITTPLPGVGVELEIREGVGPVIAAPVRTAADVARLRPFDAQAAVGPLLEAIRLVRAESPVPLIGFAGSPFTLACYLVEGGPSRDFVRTKHLLWSEPATWAALLDRLTAMTVAYLEAQVAAGVEAVQVFDSWVGILAPRDYERGVAPWLARIFGRLAELGVPAIHFGTGTAGLLERQAAAGGDVIGLDWRVDLAEGWARVPDRAVQGNLDPALLLGDSGPVEEAARAILDAAAGRPGHVFNLGHGVLPATDPDHLARLVDLVHGTSARAGRVTQPGTGETAR